jgi:hypothetical protein
MAPRALESKESFLARLEKAAKAGATEVRFGQHHFSHAVCLEQGTWRVRRLFTDRAKAEAFLKEHGHFMPENNEQLAEPGPDVVLEAPSLDALLAAFRKGPWPY